jgi:AcrR family transcriptional regulator
MGEPLVPREDARAALEARRELGPAYEEELAERFAERIEAKLADRPPAKTNAQSTAIAIVSLLVSIPLIAIAGGTVGLAGVALVCLALVLVNYFARR